jgi:Domain of unknown function (DUF6268)
MQILGYTAFEPNIRCNTLSKSPIICLGVLLLVLFLPRDAPAQSTQERFISAHRDFLRLATGEGRDFELRYLFEPEHDFRDFTDANLSLNELHFEGEAPIIITPNFFLRVMTHFSIHSYNFHNLTIAGEQLNSESLYKSQLGLGFGYFLNDDWLLTSMIKPGVFSNFSVPLETSQMDIYGEAFVIYRNMENLQFITGIVTDQAFDDVRVYPVAAMRWRTEDHRVHFKFTPPVATRLSYEIRPGLVGYASFVLSGDKYRVHLDETETNFDLRIQDKRLGAGVTYYLDPHWNLSFEIGSSISSRFKFNLDQTDLPDDRTHSTIYSYVSLGYAL